VVTRYTSCTCTHMDRSPLLYVHVGLLVRPTKVSWCPRPGLTMYVIPILVFLYRPLCSRLRPASTTNQSGLFDFLTLKVHGVQVACDVRYLSANFGLPTPLCSRLRPDVCDRQTDIGQTSDKSIAQCPRLFLNVTMKKL